MDKCTQHMKEILRCVDIYLESYNQWDWMQKASEDNITRLFKCAKDVENICCRIEEIDCKVEFENNLKTLWEIKCRTDTCYDFNLIRTACDMILKRFLTCHAIDNNVSVIAVEKYFNHCGRERLKSLLKNLILQAEESKTLVTLIKQLIESSECDAVAFKCEVTSLQWANHIHSGSISLVSEQVSNMITDPEGLELVLRIMLMEDKSDDRLDMKRVISETLVAEMNTSKRCNIWNNVISDTDKVLFVLVCKHYPVILSAVIDCIIFHGRSMICSYTAERYSWNSIHNSGITFSTLVKLVKCLMESEGVVKHRMNTVLQEMKNSTKCSVWVDIERQCALPVFLK